MMGTVVFVANGFTRENARLQPWRYILELATYKSKDKNVIVVTDGSREQISEEWAENFCVIQTNLLNVKHQSRLKQLIMSLDPLELWWSTTPRTVAFYPLLSSIPCTKMAFITCPLYSWWELIRATLAGVPFRQLKALWQQRVIPRTLFRWMLNKSFIDNVIVQSNKNQMILENSGVDGAKIHLIPVGIDKEDTEPIDEMLVKKIRQEVKIPENKVIYLYLGALRPIRGFDALIKAFPDVVKKNPLAHLVILARGVEDKVCKELENKLYTKGMEGNVTVVAGWLKREEVWAYIEMSDVVVLPFVLVPSDIPIAVLEALARGKPVVVSPVDGLPELARGKGVIVDPLNVSAFSRQLYLLSIDAERREQLGMAARLFINDYPRWEDVGRMAEDIIVRNKDISVNI